MEAQSHAQGRSNSEGKANTRLNIAKQFQDKLEQKCNNTLWKWTRQKLKHRNDPSTRKTFKPWKLKPNKAEEGQHTRQTNHTQNKRRTLRVDLHQKQTLLHGREVQLGPEVGQPIAGGATKGGGGRRGRHRCRWPTGTDRTRQSPPPAVHKAPIVPVLIVGVFIAADVAAVVVVVVVIRNTIVLNLATTGATFFVCVLRAENGARAPKR